MPQLVPIEELFKGRHFDQEIIVLCVRWYLSYKLSYRDLVAMMGERGIGLAHTTILRWVQHYTPEFEKRWKRNARSIPGAIVRRAVTRCKMERWLFAGLLLSPRGWWARYTLKRLILITGRA